MMAPYVNLLFIKIMVVIKMIEEYNEYEEMKESEISNHAESNVDEVSIKNDTVQQEIAGLDVECQTNEAEEAIEQKAVSAKVEDAADQAVIGQAGAAGVNGQNGVNGANGTHGTGTNFAIPDENFINLNFEGISININLSRLIQQLTQRSE
jgi:hypothetical protein